MREIARKIIFGPLLLLPCTAVAAQDCRLIEYADHVEAVCTGDPRVVPERIAPAVPEKTTPNGAQVSKQRQNLERIRTMNAHRFEAPATHATPGTVPDSDRKGF